MKISVVITFLIFLFVQNASPQSSSNEFHLLFYNTENLYDTYDDPETADEEFTPGGSRHWTPNRLRKKLSSLSKVILNASGWTPPQLIALCEVENRYVLEKLLGNTPLNQYPYRIIHKDSPDPRGIDVVLLYNDESFYPLHYRYIPLYENDSTLIKTREILYVQGILGQADTLHLFVNHWPSRYSGLLESKQKRNFAAATLRSLIDEVQAKHHNPNIIITGDFNDQPTDESLKRNLLAEPPVDKPDSAIVYNLSFQWMKDGIQTIKYQSQWSVFDQLLVTGSMLDEHNKLYTLPEYAGIIKAPYLLERDERFGQFRLNRTYNGFRYHGGFSDHLPVLLKIMKNP